AGRDRRRIAAVLLAGRRVDRLLRRRPNEEGGRGRRHAAHHRPCVGATWRRVGEGWPYLLLLPRGQPYWLLLGSRFGRPSDPDRRAAGCPVLAFPPPRGPLDSRIAGGAASASLSPRREKGPHAGCQWSGPGRVDWHRQSVDGDLSTLCSERAPGLPRR